jgi:DNA-binding NarL/FixJ family response regulator
MDDCSSVDSWRPPWEKSARRWVAKRVQPRLHRPSSLGHRGGYSHAAPANHRDDRRLLLSPRETDVYELLLTGVTNREIGRLLYIEESTVKAHAHRIYDKLGVRSRSALAVQAALERADQATSAMESSSDSES